MKKITKISCWILGGILGILGFSTCYDPPVYYAVPPADYAVKNAAENFLVENPAGQLNIELDE